VKITNRSGQTLTIRTRKNAFFHAPYTTWDWFGPGQTLAKDQKEDFKLWVATGKVSTADGPGFYKHQILEDSGPWHDSHHLLLVGDGRTVVDWTAVRQKHLGGTPPPSEVREEPLDQTVRIASAIIAALATGLTTIGPYGGVPSGVAQLFSSMMLLTGPEGQDPPEPPNIADIENAVEKVVTRVISEGLQRQDASDAATSFLLAEEWLLDRYGAFKSAGAKQGSDFKELSQDFEFHLESWADPNGRFRGHIDKMRRQPEIAKWIIPAFMSGLAAHLQIWRLHALMQHRDGSITSHTIEQYQREVDRSRSALLETGRALTRYRYSILQRDSILGTPEANEVNTHLCRTLTGTDEIGPNDSAQQMFTEEQRRLLDATPIGKTARDLQAARDALAEDLGALKSGHSPKHFWKDYWTKAAPATA
jgi:hypothetical protein